MGAWVEIIALGKLFVSVQMSRPARGAWVEITIYMNRLRRSPVAPRKGRVG